MILLKFMPLYDNTDIDKLLYYRSYLNGSSFCFFAMQMFGGAEGYDYACYLVCDTKQQFNLQLGLILNKFGNLIEYHQVYRLVIRKETTRVLRLPMTWEKVTCLCLQMDRRLMNRRINKNL